jgi:hypothetical protein
VVNTPRLLFAGTRGTLIQALPFQCTISAPFSSSPAALTSSAEIVTTPFSVLFVDLAHEKRVQSFPSQWRQTALSPFDGSAFPAIQPSVELKNETEFNSECRRMIFDGGTLPTSLAKAEVWPNSINAQQVAMLVNCQIRDRRFLEFSTVCKGIRLATYSHTL